MSTRTIHYAYDQATGRHTETSTTNSDIQYGYDQLGRVNKVTVTKQNGLVLGTSLVINYFYTPMGLIDHITYPNGTETDYAYNTLNRLTSVTNKVTANGNVLSSYSYTLNADGMRSAVTEHQLESDGTTSTTTKTWTYDNLQRLTGEAVVSSISANSYTDTYSYDLLGNRLSKVDVANSLTETINDVFNNNDQLTNETGTGPSSYTTTFGYDTNGSMTSVSRTGSSAESDTYGYDLQHRLSSATISRTEQGQSVAITASYSYDDSGYRASGTVTINNGTPTTTSYLTDTMNPTGYTQVLEEHTNGASAPSMSYIIGLAVVAQTNSSGATSHIMPDGSGSTRQLTDATGNITARFTFDAYGNLLYLAIGVLNQPATKILYTGQQFDPALLQYYLRARYYQPQLGRFASMDPFSGISRDPLSLQKYLYAHLDPIRRQDPSGLFDTAELTVLMNNIANVMRYTIKIIEIYNKAKTVLDLIQFLIAVIEIFQGGVPFTSLFEDSLKQFQKLSAQKVLDSLEMNMQKLISRSFPIWSEFLLINGAKIKGFALWLPNPGLLPQIRIPAGTFKGFSLELVLGGRKKSGSIIGVGLVIPGLKFVSDLQQIWRMDFHPIHWLKGVNNTDSSEMAAWEDRPFHYHVMYPQGTS